MVLPPKSFAEDRVFAMRANEVRYSLAPNRLGRVGDDHEVAHFRACRVEPPLDVDNAAHQESGHEVQSYDVSQMRLP